MTDKARKQNRAASGLRRRAQLDPRDEELMQTRAELEAALARNQDLFDHAPVGYVTLDRNGRIVRANSKAGELLGLPQAELVRRPLTARCDPSSGDLLRRHLQELLETRQPQSARIRVHHSEETDLELAVESHADGEGQHCHMALVDVSERERARAALETARAELESQVIERTAELTRANARLTESEERFRLLAENAYDVVFRYVLHPRAGFEYLSPSVEALTGHGPEDFYADPGLLFTLCEIEERDWVWSALRGDASLGEPVEFSCTDKMGGKRWAELRASSAYDANGNVVAVEGIAREVTQRKRAELALKHAHDGLEQRVRERTQNLALANEALVAEVDRRRQAERELLDREANLRTIVETVVDGVIGLDERGRIQSFNPAAERIFGYSAAQVTGWSLEMLIAESSPGAPPGSVLHLDAGTLCTNGICGEVTGVRKDGSTFPMEVGTGRVVDGRLALVCVVRDVSERRRLEGELRQSQKMEAIGALASGIAHDFNNLLQGIIGCADLALGKLHDGDPAHRFVHVLKKASMSGAGVVGQLMDFGRKREVASRVFDLNRLISDQDTLYRRLLGEDVKLCLGFEPDVAPVRCDPTQLEQVLMNLLINARHAMPGGGEIEIETKQVEFTADSVRPAVLAPGRYIALSVRDTGHGMDEATRQRIFEPFFTTKEEGRGTGLGLSGVYSIVTGAGGHVDVTSQIGEGTTFVIYLPRSDEPLVSDSEGPVGGQRGTETVLLVEDEPLVQMSVRYYLDRRGYRVLVASDSDEALGILAEATEPIHLLLTDVTLPGGSGPRIAVEARARWPELRVLYMTASPREAPLEQHGLAARDPVLNKPFSERDLISRVRVVLRGSRPPSAGPEGPGVDAPGMLAIPPAPPLPSQPQVFEEPPLPSQPLFEDSRESPGETRLPKGAHVLVVEDEPFARLTTREVLEEEGYRVTDVSSGAAALAAWRQAEGSIDLLLTDVGLPDMNGIELVGQLRAERPELAVVVVSGWLGEEPQVKALRKSPRSALLEKPVELARIIEEVARALG